jgi:hypothetical protein
LSGVDSAEEGQAECCNGGNPNFVKRLHFRNPFELGGLFLSSSHVVGSSFTSIYGRICKCYELPSIFSEYSKINWV